MFFNSVLLVATSLVGAAFAQLPVDGTYNIVNRETGFRWDLREGNPAPGTDVIGFPPNGGANQKWNVSRVALQGTSGIYTFVSVRVPEGRAAYSTGIQGSAITSQPFSSPFNVTQRGAIGDTAFFITIPGSPFAVTSPSTLVSPAEPLVLQSLVPANNLNVWTFQGVQ